MIETGKNSETEKLWRKNIDFSQKLRIKNK